MATTPNGIAFQELEGSPRLRFSTSGVTAQREFKVAWSSAIDFVKEVAGVYQNAGTGVYILAPIPFPIGNIPNLVARGASIDPFDPSNPNGSSLTSISSGSNTYDSGAKVTIDYEQLFAQPGDGTSSPPVPQVQDGTFLEYSRDIGAEYLTLPGYAWKWTADSKPLPDNMTAGILIPTTQHILTWSKVQRPPYKIIRDKTGCVNSSTFANCPAETLLFLGAKIKQNFSASFVLQSTTLEYSFAEKHILTFGNEYAGWNHFYRNGVGWSKLTGGDGGAPYSSTTFESLFQQTDTDAGYTEA